MSRALPVATVIAAIIVIWYLGAVWMNAQWERDQAERAGVEITLAEIIPKTMAQERPVLPAPHQVAVELWDTVAAKPVTSKRSLVWHGWITLSATLLGFAFGTALGVILAIGIVASRTMDISVMPWVIASQMVPILAIAPMMIVVLNAADVGGLVAKAMISMYLSFFPVVVGMVKGLRSPDALQLDLMRTYSANGAQTFLKLRLPASLPYLFTSMKVGVAASLVGAIVAEMTLSQDGGLGSRLLNGSYYGQTMMIWAALIASAVLAGGLIPLIGAAQRLAMRGRPT
ncbi:ABC transporter permease [Pikeienuella piscinae]|uniref:ABC transporter permease n=1 Tax=Pikeienuella piscinae TaxID=2748098 RepID=A0A7M3T5Y0_9RHOB|nr:ABC transporter permease [Pikeienuella piscinae]QIE57411.1 ABC transporter permease [Pikeienuella piscinae]